MLEHVGWIVILAALGSAAAAQSTTSTRDAAAALVSWHLSADAAEPGGPAGGASSPLRTWAVLAAPELRRAGLDDLVTAGLSQDRTIRLVERQRLDLVAGELALGALVESSGAGLRRKTGGTLKADALVLLRRDTGADGKDFVRLVVCECRSGARLRVECVLLEQGKIESAAKRVVVAVAQTRARFPEGVRRVFGVPPFVSRTLTHGYDHLQRGFSALLAEALSAQPGVAVIEVEEARQIAREIGLTDGKDVDRVVPAFVEGEYTVTRNGEDEPAVEFRARITRSAGDAQTLPPRKLKLSEAARYVGVELPALVSGVAKAAPGRAMSPEEQVSELVARADVFTLLGFWDHAAGLREAALLLKPDAAGRRLALLHDYDRLARRPMDEVSPEDRKRIDSPAVRAAVMRRVEAYLAGLAHLEHLIRNRQVSALQAVKLFEPRTTHCLLSPVGFELVVRQGKHYRMGQDELALAEEAKERFLAEVYPRVLSLSRDDLPQHRFAAFGLLDHWCSLLVKAALLRVDRTYRTKADLDWIYGVLTDITPDGTSTQLDVQQFLLAAGRCYPDDLKHPDAFTEPQWIDFLTQLSENKHRVARLYGRYGLLHYRWQHGGKKAAEEEGPALLREADALLRVYAATPYSAPSNGSRRRESMYIRLSSLRGEMAREIEGPAYRAPGRPFVARPKPPGWEKDPRQWAIHGYPETLGRLKFDEIPLQVTTLSGQTMPLKGKKWQGPGGWGVVSHWQQCGPALDVLWDPGVVLSMRTKGLAREVLCDPKIDIDDVQWDGKALWLGTRQAGIWRLSPEGKLLGKIGIPQGLPPADRGVRLHPLGPGKVCAIGSFGEHERAWCAIVAAEGDAARVRVFHEATHVPAGKDAQQEANDPQQGFSPHWVHEYHGPPGSPRTLLVGRYAPAFKARWLPLSINLETLQVSIFAHELGAADHRYAHSYFSRNGEILEASDSCVTHWAAPGTTWPDGKPWRQRCTNVTGAGLLRGCLLLDDGWLYAPGSCWFRMDPETFAEEMLVPGRLPSEYSMTSFAVSSHYGLVAWRTYASSHPGPYRVTVREAPAASSVPSPEGKK